MEKIYSKETIIKEYNNYYEEWNSAIKEMMLFQKKEYYTNLNLQFKLGVKEHIYFAENAMQIIKDATTKMSTNEFSQYEFEQLKKLFNGCKSEHNNIERTYKDLDGERSIEYYELEKKLMKFRENVDFFKCLDDTLDLVSKMINDKNTVVNNMVEINGDVSNVQIQQNTNNSIQQNM